MISFELTARAIDRHRCLRGCLHSPAFPTPQYTAIKARVLDEDLHAPHLIDLEVTQAARRLVLRGLLESWRGTLLIDDLSAIRLMRHPHYPFLRRVWQYRSNLSAYDACYVALAEFLDAPLLTLDVRLAGAGAAARIELF